MKYSKELKVGIIAILSVALLVAGVNFLKGNSFFGGDDVYYGYFPNSGGIAPANSVVLSGVPVGKILSVEYVPENPPEKRVKIAFNIHEEGIKITKGSTIQIGSIDLFSKGILLTLDGDHSKGYYKSGASLYGTVSKDMMQQVQAYADPITKNLQSLMSNVDRAITSLSSFWDTTATSELEQSMKEVKIAIKRLGHVAEEVDDLMATEKAHLKSIFYNVDAITDNLRESNEEVRRIIGNAQKITDDMVTADFKTVVEDAKETIKSLNAILAEANSGKGSLSKLIHDEQLYNEVVETNKALQDLVADLKLHPERYIHFSVLGSKNKGVSLTPDEERKLRKVIDTIH
ncbi:MAG: MCE family protein [Bacteroidetes bacterium]|nr:MAG: MCE family protein [Bacteroidota bacterium]